MKAILFRHSDLRARFLFDFLMEGRISWGFCVILAFLAHSPHLQAQYAPIQITENAMLDFRDSGTTLLAQNPASNPLATPYSGGTTGGTAPYSPPLSSDPLAVSPPSTGNTWLQGSGQGSLFPNSGNSLLPWLGNTSAPQAEPNPILPESMQHMRRFVERFCAEYTFIPRDKNSPDGLSMNQITYQTEFYIPLDFMPGKTPIYIKPGASLYWWAGPFGQEYDMPGSTFSAFIDLDYDPRITDYFELQGWLRLGVHSDFEKVTSDAIRLQGSLVGNLQITQFSTAVFGAQYINRNHIKLLPVAGIIWRPNEFTEWELVFPYPKLFTRLRCLDTVNQKLEWWGFLGAEYGGDSWAITSGGENFLTDYNDIRIGVGIEGRFKDSRTARFKFEIGGAFNRELYANDHVWCKPGNEIYLRAKIAF